jgi:ArsR family metal-binding transcriptional regulator
MNDKKKYAFRSHEIVIAPVESREEAQMLANHIISTVNDIWIRKEEIEANFQGGKVRPNVLDLFKLTPKTNCRECGLTCMAFATALRDDPSKLSLCPYFPKEEYKKLVTAS